MRQYMFSIYDSKAEAYMQPFFAVEAGVAKREFGNLVADSSHPIGQHPEDYTLFVLANWNMGTGTVTPENAPLAIANGLDYTGSVVEGSFGGTA